MRIIRFVPGAVAPATNITIPTYAPDIGAVVGAEITRIPASFVLAHGPSAVPCPHADGAPVVHAGLAVANHADHAHDLISQGTGAPPTVPLGFDAIPLTQLEDAGAAALHTFAGGGATGVQDETIPAHVVTQPNDHPAADIAAALIHNAADIAASLIDHANSGVTPAVAAVPTRVSTRIITLDVATQLGDLLTLAYLEVGARVPVS